MSSLAGLLGLAASTLVSEDLASIGAGLLARDGHVSIAGAAATCAAGVYAGDLGLWCLGRTFGRRLLGWPWLSGRLPAHLDVLAGHIDAHLGATIVLSRVVPGSRLPVYVAAGIWGRRPRAFAAWSLLAVGVWTPALVVASAFLGARVGALLEGVQAGVATACAGGAIFAALMLAGRLASSVPPFPGCAIGPVPANQRGDGKRRLAVRHRTGSLVEST